MKKDNLLKNEKPSLVGVSLVAVFLATMILNEVVKTTSLSVQASSRQVASLNEQDIKKEISWEHGWAKQLSEVDAKDTGKSAARPSLQDELLYGTLEGLYSVQFQNGKIVSLELNDERKTENSARVSPADLLEKYKAFFSDRLERVKATEDIGGNKTFDLIGAKDQIIGKALVELDLDGHVKKLSIKNL
ncbi:MAG: hypothetical protein AABY64_11420 [Bdellovibrionota bacterium]